MIFISITNGWTLAIYFKILAYKNFSVIFGPQIHPVSLCDIPHLFLALSGSDHTKSQIGPYIWNILLGLNLNL